MNFSLNPHFPQFFSNFWVTGLQCMTWMRVRPHLEVTIRVFRINAKIGKLCVRSVDQFDRADYKNWEVVMLWMNSISENKSFYCGVVTVFPNVVFQNENVFTKSFVVEAAGVKPRNICSCHCVSEASFVDLWFCHKS